MIKDKKGFTLIELLVVVAIITILAAAIVVGINPAKHFRTARNATRWSHMNAIATTVYSYAVENAGAFPTCIPPEDPPTPADISACDAELVPDYIHALPADPQAGETYQIIREGEGIKITSTAQEAIDDSVYLIQ